MLYSLKPGNSIEEYERFIDFVENYDTKYQMRVRNNSLVESHKFKREAVMEALEKEFKPELAWLDLPYPEKPPMTEHLRTRIITLRHFLYELPTNYLNGTDGLQYRWSLICYTIGYVLKNMFTENEAA